MFLVVYRKILLSLLVCHYVSHNLLISHNLLNLITSAVSIQDKLWRFLLA